MSWKWKSLRHVLLFAAPWNCRPGFSVHGFFLARILEWVAIPFSRVSFQPRDRTQLSCIAGRFFTSWATREAQNKPKIRFFKKMSRTNGQARGWAFQTYTLDYDTLPLLRPCCPRPCHHGGLDPIFWAAWIWVVLWRADSLEKTDAGRNWGQEEKGMTEDEMAGWHHRLNGHEFEWTPGVGDGQGGLVCCDSWGRKESDTTERLNWIELRQAFRGVWRKWFEGSRVVETCYLGNNMLKVSKVPILRFPTNAQWIFLVSEVIEMSSLNQQKVCFLLFRRDISMIFSP